MLSRSITLEGRAGRDIRHTRGPVADLPIALGGTLNERLGRCLDTEAKIPRALDALGPIGGRDVVLIAPVDGIRARQLADLGARLVVAPEADVPCPDRSPHAADVRSPDGSARASSR